LWVESAAPSHLFEFAQKEAEEAGVEPTEDAWRPPTGLKPARPTGSGTLPRVVYPNVALWCNTIYAPERRPDPRRLCNTLKEIAERSETVVLMVPDTPDVRSVLFDPEPASYEPLPFRTTGINSEKPHNWAVAERDRRA
jgi:hypothetical protein